MKKVVEGRVKVDSWLKGALKRLVADGTEKLRGMITQKYFFFVSALVRKFLNHAEKLTNSEGSNPISATLILALTFCYTSFFITHPMCPSFESSYFFNAFQNRYQMLVTFLPKYCGMHSINLIFKCRILSVWLLCFILSVYETGFHWAA
jgi:hypothetical protein